MPLRTLIHIWVTNIVLCRIDLLKIFEKKRYSTKVTGALFRDTSAFKDTLSSALIRHKPILLFLRSRITELVYIVLISFMNLDAIVILIPLIHVIITVSR